jgi:hypothetical protein
LEVFFGEGQGAFGEGVFEGLDGHVGKVFVLAYWDVSDRLDVWFLGLWL